MKKLKPAAYALLPLAVAMAQPAAAQDTKELKVGVASEATSIDPHFHNVGQNNALRRHIFESLIATDANQKLLPALAESWKAVDDTTWEIKLRPDVKFSNGEAFTARDYVYTMCRVPLVENSPSSFTVFTRGIESIETPDPLTIRVKTATPQPLFPNNMTTLGILSAAVFGAGDVKYGKDGCENMGTPPKSSDFNDPAKAVGTGPFKLKEYTRGTHIILEANEGYWGEKPVWQRVVMRPITSAGPRVAALLAGDVDMIENPPIQDFDKIKGAGFTLVEGLSNRIIYIHLDQFEDKTPGVKGTDKNPFKDVRVREALSKAINREAIVERIMGGVAQAAGELLPYPLFGTTKDAKPVAYDPEASKKLLAEAGYPNGFELTIGTPNDRYINDEKVAQAVAQMFTRVGIKTNIDAMTASTFFSRRNKHEFSAYLAGWGADSGEMSNSLNALVVTPNKDTGGGHTNRGRYSNAEVDALVMEAQRTIDDAKREELLQKASKIAMDDYALLPLHFEVTPWAFKKTLSYTPRVDQYTLVTEVKPAQ
ncbi:MULTISPECIES: ABC transporter substrate-binding protein [Chelatococcus]|uniref:Peptide/nickel transport system substrate-binding protein n=1 Tax=Chelatococcus caeni TaxID=1348468 RepID=A0A840BWA2_9HYPH|nr:MULTISPECIES: ABC transporter substrate-binding protein [Chelatococcus]MBB4015992.1 peptide/nickel transport system substrate-binding protein [Chelatococcus caeni]